MDSQNNEPAFKVQYTTKDILDKTFKTKVRGYDQDEVDEFLDGIIRDYESFGSELERLRADNARLLTRTDELTKQLSVTKNVAAATPQQPSTNATNYDILKRLSNLERHVFGSKLSDAGNPSASEQNSMTHFDQY